MPRKSVCALLAILALGALRTHQCHGQPPDIVKYVVTEELIFERKNWFLAFLRPEVKVSQARKTIDTVNMNEEKECNWSITGKRLVYRLGYQIDFDSIQGEVFSPSISAENWSCPLKKKDAEWIGGLQYMILVPDISSHTLNLTLKPGKVVRERVEFDLVEEWNPLPVSFKWRQAPEKAYRKIPPPNISTYEYMFVVLFPPNSRLFTYEPYDLEPYPDRIFEVGGRTALLWRVTTSYEDIVVRMKLKLRRNWLNSLLMGFSILGVIHIGRTSWRWRGEEKTKAVRQTRKMAKKKEI